MKKAITLCIILFSVSANVLTGQVQLSAPDMYRMGEFTMALDATGGFDPGTPGPGKTWDFSNLENQSPYQFSMILYNGKAHGNDANLARVDGGDTFDFILSSGSTIYEILPLNDFDRVIYWKRRAFSCPVSFNSVNGDSIAISFYHTGAEIGLNSYDSVRIDFYMVINSLADAWGTLKLPTGNFDALRITTETQALISVWGRKGQNAYAHIPAFDTKEVSVNYQWYTNGKGGYIAAYDPESGEMRYQVSAVLSSETVKTGNDIVFANPVEDRMQVSNTGTHQYTVSIFDMQGKLIETADIGGGSAFLFETFAWGPGVYSMVILDKDTQSIRYRKIVKR